MPERRCKVSGKVRYGTRVGAFIALSNLQRQDKPGHHEKRAYFCKACRAWHLTSRM